MFIRSSRICCLCLKQCGTNIEAAHIIDESKGGSNDSDNGIPVCFDCHAEVGAYNDQHPKGNKFRPEELKARRDRLYELVESGVIYAQIVVQRLRLHERDARDADLGSASQPPKASGEAVQFLAALLSTSTSIHAVAQKIALLNNQDRAYILDGLSRSAIENAQAMSVIGQVVKSPAFPKNEATLIIEQIVRAVTLYGDVGSKSEFLRAVPTAILGAVYEGLRLALFEDIIGIINQDQFEDVNRLVPAVVEHVGAIPPQLYKDYVFALLQQARSDSFRGAPAARNALWALPDEVAKAAMDRMDTEFLFWNSQHKVMRRFAERYKHLASGAQHEIFDDLSKLSNREFANKHIPPDLYE